MSFDRPGLPLPGPKAEDVEIDEDLRAEGVELNTDGQVEGLGHPGGLSAGPQPNPPRRPSHEAAESTEAPVDDPAHEDPARD